MRFRRREQVIDAAVEKWNTWVRAADAMPKRSTFEETAAERCGDCPLYGCAACALRPLAIPDSSIELWK